MEEGSLQIKVFPQFPLGAKRGLSEAAGDHWDQKKMRFLPRKGGWVLVSSGPMLQQQDGVHRQGGSPNSSTSVPHHWYNHRILAPSLASHRQDEWPLKLEMVLPSLNSRK